MKNSNLLRMYLKGAAIGLLVNLAFTFIRYIIPDKQIARATQFGVMGIMGMFFIYTLTKKYDQSGYKKFIWISVYIIVGVLFFFAIREFFVQPI